MALDALILPAAVAGGLTAAASLTAWLLYSKFFVRPPPNRALVLYGGRTPEVDPHLRTVPATAVIRSPRVLVGGSAFAAPWNRSLGYLSLTPIEVDVTVRAVHSSGGGGTSGWEARIGVQAKIPADPKLLVSAAENLLGKSEEEIRTLVRQAVEGAGPALLARHGAADPEPDWERLGSEIQAAAAADLVAVGLVVQSLSVKQLLRVTPAVATAAPPPPKPGPARTFSAAPEPDERTPSSVDPRLSRLERSVGVLGAQIDLLVREGVLPREKTFPTVRFEPPSPLRAGASGPDPSPPAGRPPAHDSMGGDSPPRSRATPRGTPPGEGRGETRSLLDAEPEG